MDECPDGFILDEANSRCECPEGQELVGETCEDKCPDDQTRIDGTCQEKPPCPEGLILYEKTNECRCPAGQEMDKNDKCEIIDTGIFDDQRNWWQLVGFILIAMAILAMIRILLVRKRNNWS